MSVRIDDVGDSVEPKKGKTGPKPKLEAHRELLKKIVADTPDVTLFEIRDALPVEVTHQTVANELYKLKLAYKKQLKAAEQHRPDIAEKRAAWKVIQLGLDPKNQRAAGPRSPSGTFGAVGLQWRIERGEHEPAAMERHAPRMVIG